MASFASMMALSRTQGVSQQESVQKALQERQRKEQEKKKKEMEQNQKMRELEQQRLKKHFADMEKEKEKLKKQEEEKRAWEARRERAAEDIKNKLLYGPKKASKMAGSSSSSPSHSKDGSSRRKRLSDSDDDEPAPALALTREELREKKLQAQLKRSVGTTGKSTITRTYHKHGGRLPGGAVDMTVNPSDVASSSTAGSVRQRLAAMPNTLTKLQENKRDRRTIDEIVRDMAKAKQGKVIGGEDAKEFDDWFGDSKKKGSMPTSGTHTPLSSSPGLNSSSQRLSSDKRATPPIKSLPPKSSLSSAKAGSSRGASSDRERPVPSKTHTSKLSSSSSAARSSSMPSFQKKRPRSPSPERYPSKHRSPPTTSSSRHKRGRAGSEELDDSNVSDMIWAMMGKRRSDYVHDDVFSDEEDMDAGASDIEREEMRSARLAKREDQIALQEEKRREEEKKRRKTGRA